MDCCDGPGGRGIVPINCHWAWANNSQLTASFGSGLCRLRLAAWTGFWLLAWTGGCELRADERADARARATSDERFRPPSDLCVRTLCAYNTLTTQPRTQHTTHHKLQTADIQQTANTRTFALTFSLIIRKLHARSATRVPPRSHSHSSRHYLLVPVPSCHTHHCHHGVLSAEAGTGTAESDPDPDPDPAGGDPEPAEAGGT
jgi:hypothetical protein